jgi:predicted RNA-binding Zn-ribbon protein involved in translation (DUF1610 family)
MNEQKNKERFCARSKGIQANNPPKADKRLNAACASFKKLYGKASKKGPVYKCPFCASIIIRGFKNDVKGATARMYVCPDCGMVILTTLGDCMKGWYWEGSKKVELSILERAIRSGRLKHNWYKNKLERFEE